MYDDGQVIGRYPTSHYRGRKPARRAERLDELEDLLDAATTVIVSISKPAPGRVHDLEIRRRGPPLPSSSHIYADSG